MSWKFTYSPSNCLPPTLASPLTPRPLVKMVELRPVAAFRRRFSSSPAERTELSASMGATMGGAGGGVWTTGGLGLLEHIGRNLSD